METVCNWSIEKILAKPIFTDKNGNTRENVLKRVELKCSGLKNGKEISEKTAASFSLINLENFVSYTELTNEQVLEWALASLKPGEKENIEKRISDSIAGNKQNEGMIEITLNI